MRILVKNTHDSCYGVSPSELRNPEFRGRLGMDDTWVVKLGDEWLPLPDVLAMTPEELLRRASSPENLAADALRQAAAPLGPGSLFALALRLLGLWLVWQAADGLVSWLAFSPPEFSPFSPYIPKVNAGSLLIPSLFRLAAGLWLLRAPLLILAWVFRARQ